MDKDFTEEFHRIYNLYNRNSSFLFLKAADGELLALDNQHVNNGEFQNDESVPEIRRKELLDSLQFKHLNYYLGVMCPCCCHRDGRSDRMKELAGQSEEHLTYANIFVNANYPLYKEYFLESYKKHDVWLVCHESSAVEDLPFAPEKVFKVKRNAWVNSYDTINKIGYLQPKGKLLLFATGPFGNILGHKLFQELPDNKMLDIGSTLNPFLKSESFQRDYYVDSNSGFGARKCVWN